MLNLRDPRNSRPSFTLAELLIVMGIISILASATLFAMYDVVEQAKATRTRAQVVKLHEMIMAKWETYNTRPLRVTMPALPQPASGPPRRWPVIPEPFIDAGSPANGRWDSGETYTDANGNGQYDSGLARVRLDMLRDLMRMELPDRISDLVDGPAALWPSAIARPALWQSYRRRAGFVGNTPPTSWSTTHQGAECLYLIVASIREADTDGLEFFKESEIGDTDGDGMLEILDGWGRPIEFLRWPAGYTSEVQPRNPTVGGDTFDPHRVDTRPTYQLIPLIFSAGSDGIYDIVSDRPTGLRYRLTDPPNDPYHSWAGPSLVGMSSDVDSDGELNDSDNVTNHLLDAG